MGPTKVLIGLSIVMFATAAHADRWIVKNAKVMPPSARVIKQLNFGGSDNYTVVEASEGFFSLMAATQSDMAVPDPKIGLVNEQPPSAVGQPGWHIERLK